MCFYFSIYLSIHSLEDRWGTTRPGNQRSPFLSFLCSPRRSLPNPSNPGCYLPVVFSICLSFSLPVQCPGGLSFCKSRSTCDMPIPLPFASFYSGQEFFIGSNGFPNPASHLFVGDVVFAQDAKETSELLISTVCIFLSISAVNVQVSQEYKNIDTTRERNSLIFQRRSMFLSSQMILSFVSAAMVWAILEHISGMDASSVTMAPKYLKLWTVFSFTPLTLMLLLVLLVLLVINLVFWTLICMLHAVEVSSRRSTRLAKSNSEPARPSMSSAKRKFEIVLPPMATVDLWSSSASTLILSRENLEEGGWEQTALSYSDCSSEPASCAAIEANCTGGLVKEILNCVNKVCIDILQPHSCPKCSVPHPIESLF